MFSVRERKSDAAAARQPPWRHREALAGGLERFEFTVLCGHDIPAALDGVWRAVLSGMQRRQFWHLREWFENYAHTLGRDEIRFFIACYCRRPIGILPLCERERMMCGMRLRTLELPTHAHMPLSDFIVDTRFITPEFLLRLEHFLAQEKIAWDALVLQNAPADSCVLRLVNAGKRRHVVAASRRYDCIRVRGDYEALARTFAGKTRENFRRARRRLAQAGTVEYLSASSGDALTAAFSAFLDVEASGWKGSEGAGTAIKLDERLLEFYRGLMHGFAPGGGCEINVLKLNGDPIAAQFCLVVDGTVYALKIGYDEAYAKFSPGKILLDEMLRRALDARRQVNLTSSAPWHADWRPSVETAFRVVIYNHSPRARIAHLLALADMRSRVLYRHWVKRPMASLRAGWSLMPVLWPPRPRRSKQRQ